MRALWIVTIAIAQAGQAVGPRGAARQEMLVAEEVFKATVMSVADGDTLVVGTSNERLTLHLQGIDAPELSQAGGPESKAALSRLTLGKTVLVRVKSAVERVARVEVDGSDISATLIRRGMAWHCPRYTNDRELATAEAEARASKRGLWRAARPMPPWLHRGAGTCWEQRTGVASSREDRPDFSGAWTAISPPGRVGQQLTIRQDATTLTLRQDPQTTDLLSWSYKLDGTTSRALSSEHGPMDVVAKTRWNGRSLVLDERQWRVRGEEAINIRHVLWLDDRGFLNMEISTPRPIGEQDTTRMVLQREPPPRPPRSAAPAPR